jgi:farnesyl-diphosphate farnesyltransferase
LAPLWRDQLQQTQAHLTDGLRYSMALQSRRLRLATALPALLGARTVALLTEAGPMALAHKVKMPRSEVRALLWRLLLAGVSVQSLQREFDRLSSPVQA